MRISASCLVTLLILTVLMGHPADPNPHLARHAIFATDTIIFGDQARDTMVMPEGPIGTNNLLHMEKIPSNAGQVQFGSDIFIGDSIIFPLWGPNITITQGAAIYRDSAGATLNHDTQIHPPVDTTIPYDPPVPTSADWYNIWPADSIAISQTDLATSDIRIAPGSYGRVEIYGEDTLSAGEYHFRELILGPGSTLLIDKKKSEYCRIFVRDSLIFSDKGGGMQIRTKEPDDLGRVLLYSTAERIEVMKSWQQQTSAVMEASLVAPRAEVIFNNFPEIHGQILARKIRFEGDFDANQGEFEPFITAGVTVAEDHLKEDPHMDPATTTNNDTALTVSLSAPLPPGTDDQGTAYYADLFYEIVPGSGPNGQTKDTDYIAADTGTLRFTHGTALLKIPLTLIDEKRYDPAGTLSLRLSKPAGYTNSSSFSLTFPKDADTLIHEITVENDDPENQNPHDILLSRDSIHEDSLGFAAVLTARDTMDNIPDIFTFTITGGAHEQYFDLSGPRGDTLIMKKKFDFEGGQRTAHVQITVTDDGGKSYKKDVGCTIRPMNDSVPRVLPDHYTTAEDSTLTGNISSLVTDGDLPAQDNRVRINQSRAHAYPKHAASNSFSLQTDGTFSYTPKTGFVGTDTFYYRAADSTAYTADWGFRDTTVHLSADTCIEIEVTPVNDHDPEIRDTSLILPEGDSIDLDLSQLVTDKDLPHDALQITLSADSAGAAGTAFMLTDTTLRYRTARDTAVEIFADNFTLAVEDRQGHTTSTVIPVTIEKRNDNAPNAHRDSAEVPLGRTAIISTMIDNDTDKDRPHNKTDLRLEQRVSGPFLSGVTVTPVGDGRSVEVHFDANTHNSAVKDSVALSIADPVPYDSHVNYDTAWLILQAAVPDTNAPVALDDSVHIAENDSTNQLISGASSVMDNDSKNKSGTSLSHVTLMDSTTCGRLKLQDDGTFLYDHDDSAEIFFDRFTYRLFDVNGDSSFPATVHIIIDTLNDNVPVIQNEFVTVTENTQTRIDILANDHDADILTTLTPAVDSSAQHGSVSLDTSAGILTYRHSGQEGTTQDRVILSIQDITPYDTAAVHTAFDTVFITIRDTNNHTPDGTGQSYILREGDTLSVTDSLKGLLHDATDKDIGTGSTLTARMAAGFSPHHGSMTINHEGTFTYTHDDSENFHDSCIYEISDGKTVLRRKARFQIQPVNDNLPVTANDSCTVAEGAVHTCPRSVLANDHDIDRYLDGSGGTVPTILTAQPDSSRLPRHGTVTMDSAGYFTYIHDGSESVTDSFGYIAIDTCQQKDFQAEGTVHMQIEQTPPAGDSAFYYDINGDGTVESALLYFDESLDPAVTDFDLAWLQDDTTAITVSNAKGANTEKTEIRLDLQGTGKMRTSGTLVCTLTHTRLDSMKTIVRIQDRAAPVPTHGVYTITPDTADPAGIDIFFSEEVQTPVSPAPYDWFDTDDASSFEMHLTRTGGGQARESYRVDSLSIAAVAADDSLRVIIPNILSDLQGNLQDSTVWVPIEVTGTYPQGLELYIHPQPMTVTSHKGRGEKAQEISADVLNWFAIPARQGTRGTAFILRSKAPINRTASRPPRITILDAAGNVVRRSRAMDFTMTPSREICAAAIWDGTNEAGRPVGKGAYLAIIEVAVETVDGVRLEQVFRKPVGVEIR
ncbi:MAG: Ig-like domain-containing protein [Fibrobacterota bacterium]